MGFAETEFDRLQGGYDAGTFYGSVQQVQRYWRFVALIYGEHITIAKSYRESHAEVLAQAASHEAGKSYPVSAEYEAMSGLIPQIDLSVQSFYIFAKIMLGNVAQAIHVYFGPAPRCSLQSHDKFRKCFAGFRDEKELVVPSDFSDCLEKLQETVVNHRDKASSAHPLEKFRTPICARNF
jgi:hypothetical protein